MPQVHIERCPGYARCRYPRATRTGQFFMSLMNITEQPPTTTIVVAARHKSFGLTTASPNELSTVRTGGAFAAVPLDMKMEITTLRSKDIIIQKAICAWQGMKNCRLSALSKESPSCARVHQCDLADFAAMSNMWVCCLVTAKSAKSH